MAAAMPEGRSAARLESKLGWKPLISMMGLMIVVFGVVLFIAWVTM